MKKDKDKELGQAGLIVMLIMSVLLTIGVSIATRSTQDVVQSRQEEEASRVFDAAESGIEEALSGALVAASGVSLSGLDQDLSASYSVDEVATLDIRLDEGHVVGVDVSGYSGPVNIEWSKISDCVGEDPASLVVAVHNTTASTVRRYAYEGCNHVTDGFLASGNGTSPYVYSASLNVDNQEDLIRIRPVYNDTYVNVSGDVDFPTQYHRILSTASNVNSSETRAVEVDRTIPTAPSIFDYVLFSGTSLIK
ncbi:hypothetical protein ACFL1M_00060 [Patescibacteria group bacterium]